MEVGSMKTTMKAQLMTTAVLLMFTIMLAEMFAFLIINLNYGSLSSSVAIATGSQGLASSLRLGAQEFAGASLKTAIGQLAAYESNPSLRKDNFITNASYYLSSMISGGAVPNSTYGADFNGQSSVVYVPNSIISGNAFSFVLWAKRLGSGSGAPRAVMLSHSDTYLDACLGGHALFSVYNGTSQKLAEGGNCSQIGTWVQYAGTYNGTDVVLYLNGTEAGSTALSGNVATEQGIVDIGQFSDPSGYGFNGLIADVQIYGKALSAGQVSSLYKEGMGGAPLECSGNVGWWPLNGNANDYSGNGNNGTATNVILDSNPVDMGGMTLSSYNSQLTRTFQNLGSICADNTAPAIYQTSSSSVSVAYTENVRINGTAGLFNYSIPVNATLNLTGEPDLFYAQQGITRYMNFVSSGGATSLIGGIGAAVGSPYGFAYGAANIIPPDGSCPSTTSSSVILVTQNALAITSSGCENSFAGLISTSNTIQGTPLVPYLGYSPSANLSSMFSEGQDILLYGPDLSAYNISMLRADAGNGAYFNSSAAPSYLDMASSKTGASQYGIFNLRGYGRQAAQFNGASSNITTQNAIVTGTSSASVSAWFYLTSKPSGIATLVTSEPTGQLQGDSININQYGDSGIGYWIYIGSTAPGVYYPGQLHLHTWYHIVGTYNGKALTLYVNGMEANSIPVTGDITQPTGSGYIGSWGALQRFPGDVANLQYYNTSLSSTQVAQLYREGIDGLPVGNTGLVGWWPLNGNANDYSGNGNNGVSDNVNSVPAPSGWPTVSTAQFNGKNSQIIVPASSSLTMTGSAFTESGWYYNTAGGDHPIFAERTGCSGTLPFQLYTELATFQNSGGTQYILFDTSTSFAADTWYYIAAVYNGATFTYYVNGIAANSMSASGSFAGTSVQADIGTETCGYFTGNLANIQLYKTALSAPQIAQSYRAGIAGAPVQNAGLVGWWPLNGNTDDYSGYGNAGVPTNVTFNHTVGAVPYHPLGDVYANQYPVPGVGSCYNIYGCFDGSQNNVFLSNYPVVSKNYLLAAQFNGKSSYISLGTPSSLEGLQDPVTITGWFYEQANPPTYQPIYAAYESTAPNELWSLVRLNSGGFAYYTSTTGGGIQAEQYSIVPTTGQWHFFAVVVSGSVSSPTLTMYLDGNGPQSWGLSGLSGTPATVPMCIGADGSCGVGSEMFRGYIADLQVYKTALSAPQIAQSYRAGIAGAPVQNAGLVGWWPLNGNANDYSGNGNNAASDQNVTYVYTGLGVPNVANFWQAIGIGVAPK